MNDRDKLFKEDEQMLLTVNSNCEPDELLKQKGIFFLKDVVKVLPVDSLKVKRVAREMLDDGIDAYDKMGVRKVWNHWIVRMKVFAPYYRANLKPLLSQINPDWDGNTLIKQKGVFLLTEVCKLIPFSTHQIRYQAKRNPNSKQEYGVWKEPELNAFVVDMEPFSVWLKDLWSRETKQDKRGK